ncbi:hypothetical protein MMC19_001129 [Ptychographa xylographoides]|nr:hypothetical protein [Ptychographa xylographoides]
MSHQSPGWLPWRQHSTRFQVLSDLHLELGSQYSHFHIPARAPYLVLAGDIGNLCHYEAYLDFLTRQCDSFQQVFLILGNHEFFGLSRAQGLRLAAQLEQEAALRGKLHVLDRTRVEVSAAVVVLGCTLHSRITPASRVAVERKVSDFRRIRGWTVDDHNAQHAADVAWLVQQVSVVRRQDAEGGRGRRRIVILTHHAPVRRGASDPKNEGNPWSDAFATDLLDVGGGAVLEDVSPLRDVQWWVFGHTHYTTDVVRGGVRLVSNQRGYVFPNVDGKGAVERREGAVLRLVERLSACFRLGTIHSDHEFDVCRTIDV